MTTDPKHRTRAYFVIRNGPAAGQRVDIVPQQTKSLPFLVYVIGRDARCHLTLDDPEVASIHAFITREDGGTYTIKDNDTASGTTLDGEPIERATLYPGCTLRLGKTVLRFDTLENKLGDILREDRPAGSTPVKLPIPAPAPYDGPPPEKSSKLVSLLVLFVLMVFAGMVVYAIGNSAGEAVAGAGPDDYPPLAAQAGAPGQVTVLYFSAEWCIYCPQQKPIMAQLDEEFPREVTFRELDIDDRDNYQIVRRYGVNSVPRIVVLDGWNDVKGHFYGLTGPDRIRPAIAQAADQTG